MARMRTVKPEYWTDQELAEAVSRDARLLYIGLWNLADEHSRLLGDPRFIKGQVFAYDDDLSPADVARLLDELADAGKVRRYVIGNSAYLYLPNLDKHQRLEPGKVASRLPPPGESASRANESAQFSDDIARGADESALARARSFKHVAGSREHVAGGDSPTESETRGAQARATRVPDPFEITDELRFWAKEHAPNASSRDHDAFMDYWRGAPGAKGVKKDWSATWRNWMRKASDEKKSGPNRSGLVEVNGHLVTERTMSNVEVVRRIAEREAQQEQRLEIEQ